MTEIEEETPEYSYQDGHLSVVGHDLEEIPKDLAEKYPHTKELDLSFNMIKTITNIEKLKELQHLVIDNNELTSKQEFPLLPNLHTLCVNSNNIEDLELFLQSMEENLPKLAYLSMLKNPACPNFFVGKRDDDYLRYRYSVIHKFPGLKFLDSTQVTDKEKAEAARVGHLLKVARPNPEQYNRTSVAKDDNIKQLPESTRKAGDSRASMGVTRYVYQGRQSEGNRFISNSDL